MKGRRFFLFSVTVSIEVCCIEIYVDNYWGQLKPWTSIFFFEHMSTPKLQLASQIKFAISNCKYIDWYIEENKKNDGWLIPLCGDEVNLNAEDEGKWADIGKTIKTIVSKMFHMNKNTKKIGGINYKANTFKLYSCTSVVFLLKFDRWCSRWPRQQSSKL